MWYLRCLVLISWGGVAHAPPGDVRIFILCVTEYFWTSILCFRIFLTSVVVFIDFFRTLALISVGHVLGPFPPPDMCSCPPPGEFASEQWNKIKSGFFLFPIRPYCYFALPPPAPWRMCSWEKSTVESVVKCCNGIWVLFWSYFMCPSLLTLGNSFIDVLHSVRCHFIRPPPPLGICYSPPPAN